MTTRKTYKPPSLRAIPEEALSLVDRLAFARAKHIAAADAGAPSRAAYLAELLPRTQIQHFDIDLDTVPRTYEAMDLLFVGGDAPEPLAAFIAANLPLCRTIPRIGLTRGMAPEGRAALLRAGFDDVILIDQTDVEETAARILAARRRYMTARTARSGAGAERAGLAGLCDPERLTPVQRRILERLHESFGRTVAGDALARAAAGTGIVPSAEALRVQLSKLRRHLTRGHFIESVYGEGYRLRRIDDG